MTLVKQLCKNLSLSEGLIAQKYKANPSPNPNINLIMRFLTFLDHICLTNLKIPGWTHSINTMLMFGQMFWPPPHFFQITQLNSAIRTVAVTSVNAADWRPYDSWQPDYHFLHTKVTFGVTVDYWRFFSCNVWWVSLRVQSKVLYYS